MERPAGGIFNWRAHGKRREQICAFRYWNTWWSCEEGTGAAHIKKQSLRGLRNSQKGCKALFDAIEERDERRRIVITASHIRDLICRE
jgi:hypothetical protein